jgi:thiosulfate/3-mercaptopyruvate sulfurtransferase
MTERFPAIIDAAKLEAHLGDDQLLIVDLCKQETYLQGHVPGAVFLEYKKIVAAKPPAMGLLPDTAHLEDMAESIGLTPDKHVIAYDDEGGGKAARLLWTLEAMGHKHMSLLDGGQTAWQAQQRPVEKAFNSPEDVDLYHIYMNREGVASRNDILNDLNNSDSTFLDTRSPAEYTGLKRFAERGGHIPGAVNMDWIMLMDLDNHLCLLPEPQLRELFESRGIVAGKQIYVYCQTHHRSALTYWVLKHLGYPRIKGYEGSWSDWGNAADTPIEA